MKNEEKAIGIGSNFRHGGRANNEKSGDCEETKDDIAIQNSFAEKGESYEKVQVHGCMNEEKSNNNSTKEPVVGIEFFVRHASEVLNWTPGFRGKEVVKR